MTALFAEEIGLAKLLPNITPYWRYLRLSDMSDNPKRDKAKVSDVLA